MHGTPARRKVVAWAMYDWANSAYSALSITILVYYIKSVVAPGTLGTLIWGWGIGISMLVAAMLSPIVGAMADANASKRWWLVGTAVPGALTACSMAIIPPEWTWTFVAAFVLTCLCFELSFCFYNGFLTEISDEESMNRVSAFGYALGYVGGGLALAIAVVIMARGDLFGLPDGTAITKDYHQCREGRFAVDVPNGTYQVTVTLGDPGALRDQMSVSIQGVHVQTVSTPAGETVELSHSAVVSDGRLVLDLKDLGGDDPAVAISGLRVEGGEDALRLSFDFGTAGSETDSQSIRVLADDRFRTWNLVRDEKMPAAVRETPGKGRGEAGGLQRDEPTSGIAGVPDGQLAFGWQRGEVAGSDAVMPVRLRVGVLIMGVWWGLFSIPAFVLLKDSSVAGQQRQSLPAAARRAGSQVAATLRNIRAYRMLAIFLLAFLIYNDGIQTVISQASVFAIEALHMPASELILVVLMIQFLALPGAWGVARLADRIGQKQALLGCLAVWTALLLAALFVTTTLHFWFMGAVLAMVMGGSQSVSRAMMGTMTPPGRTAEFFGFFNFSGKATSFFGPILFSSILAVTGSAHLSIVSLLIFFVAGWAIVSRVDVAQGRREAAAAAADGNELSADDANNTDEK